MKKLGIFAVAGLMICAGPGAWAQIDCPVVDDVDDDEIGAHDADFFTINAIGIGGTDSILDIDDTSIASNAAALAAATMAPEAFFLSAQIPTVIWLAALEDALTDPSHPEHAAACAAYSANLQATAAYQAQTIADHPAMALLWQGFPGGNELIAGLLTLNAPIWGAIIDPFIKEAAFDNLGGLVLTTTLNPGAFVDVDNLTWDGTVGANTNTNVELWLALGATYVPFVDDEMPELGGNHWEVDSGEGKAILVFTNEQVYDTFAATVGDDGESTLLSQGIIPGVPAGAPVSGPIGLGLLALAVAGGGALMIRRKK